SAIDCDNLWPALEQIVVGIGKTIGTVQSGFEVIRIGLVGPVVQVETAEGYPICDLVLDLDRVLLLELVVDERGPRVIGAAVVDVLIRHWQILQHCGCNLIDPVRWDPISLERSARNDAVARLAGQRVIDNYWPALNIRQSGKVAGTFGCSRKNNADFSRLHFVIVLASKPKESPVFYDGTADTATEQIVGIV